MVSSYVLVSRLHEDHFNPVTLRMSKNQWSLAIQSGIGLKWHKLSSSLSVFYISFHNLFSNDQKHLILSSLHMGFPNYSFGIMAVLLQTILSELWTYCCHVHINHRNQTIQRQTFTIQCCPCLVNDIQTHCTRPENTS